MKLMFTFLLLGVVFGGFGQQNTFKVRAFGPNFTFGALYQIIQLNDGSFVSVGANSFIGEYLLKTDASGHALASKTITAALYSSANSLEKTSDGGFIMCGTADTSFYVIKYTANLSEEWQKVYSPDNVGKYGSENAFKILQTPDGGYIIGGISEIYPAGGRAQSIVKTDAYGNIIFSKRYSANSVNYFSDVVATTDGNYAFLALINSNDKHDTAQITKIKPDGSVIWSRYLYEDSLGFNPSALTATSDGGLALTGSAFDFNSSTTFYQSFIAKYNNAGDLLWSKKISTNEKTSNSGYTIKEDRDGGYLFGGELDLYAETPYFYLDSSYDYVVKTNAEGALQWAKIIEPNQGGYNGIFNLIKISDGGFAACGIITIYNFENGDYQGGGFINKYNSNFEACGEMPGSEGSISDAGKSATANAIVNDDTLIISEGFGYLVDALNIDNVCSSNALPLQLLSFNATLQNKNVALQWSTANEVNTNYFVVERSKDAASFTALQQVAPKGNSASVKTYAATDLQPLQGTSYYRLKEVDKDGKITYSSIVPVTVLNNGVIIISPNPVRDAIKVIMQSAGNSTITLQVVDMKGSILATQKTSVTTGRNEISIPAASLANGVYVLKVIENNTTQTMRFVKE